MIKDKLIGKIGCLLMFVWASVSLHAQSIELLGLYSNGSAGQLKAKVELAGKQIKSVTSYAYRMSDGFATTTSDYELLDGSFLTADVEMQTGDYAYRMEVVLDDGAKLLTECVNQANTVAFMWLGDFLWTEATTAVVGEWPAVDRCFGAEQQNMQTGNTTYYKGISSKGGHIIYALPEEKNFRKFDMVLGTQNGSGTLKFHFSCNDGPELGFTVASNKISTVSTAAYPQFIPSLPLTKIRLNFTNNVNAIGNYNLARLYMERASSGKQEQQVTFMNTGGTVMYPMQVELKATATSGGKIYYRIIKGREAAELKGSVLTFKDGQSTDVVVEATQYGNEQYACATSVLSYAVRTRENIFVSSMLPALENNSGMVYLYVNPQANKLSQLTLNIYDDVYLLNELQQFDLLKIWNDTPLVSGTTGKVLAVAVPDLEMNRVFRITYGYEGGETMHSSYYEGLDMFDYLSDLSYSTQGTAQIDKAVNGSMLQITTQKYKKGFGIHAVGAVQTTLPVGMYNRFITDVGKQSGQPYVMEFALKMDNRQLTTTGPVNNSKKTTWDYPLDDVSVLHIDVLYGGDGAGNDHGSIGAPRLYRTVVQRREQTLDWQKEFPLTHNKPFRLPMKATASSGLAPVYRILKGQEFATIEDGNILNLHTIPEHAEIVVEAFQPGDREWQPTTTATCTFRFSKGFVVQKDARVELEGGQVLEELIVYGDAGQMGQVVVKNGIVQVKKLVLKYTFVPKAWNFITFPSDLDIDKISDLNAKGYYLNNKTSGRGAYYIRSYDTQVRAENPSGSVWKNLETPEVKGLKGYIMGINNALGMDPVEVTFTMDNVSLDFESSIRPLNLTLDLSRVEPGTRQDVYIKPVNVKGNTLKVSVDFQPEDLSVLPVNHAKALEEMRFTFTPDKRGIRLTLPDQTPAKIAIYNKKGTKLMKAVRYVAPMVLDLSDLKSGTYKMVINYGGVTVVRTLDF